MVLPEAGEQLPSVSVVSRDTAPECLPLVEKERAAGTGGP